MKLPLTALSGVLSTALLLGLALGGHAVAADSNVTLAFGDVNTKNSPVGKSVLLLADVASKRTNGSLKIDYFERSQLGNERELVDKLKSGTVDMADVSTGVLSNFVPSLGVITLPYLLESRAHGVKVLAGDVKTSWVKEFKDKHNIHLLGFFAGSERDLYFRVPIRAIDDLKGLKIRVVESPVYVSFVKALGALPTPVPASEVYSALQTGVVDGTDIGSATYVTQKIYEQASHVARMKWLYGFQGVLVSDRSWRRLSAGQQQALQESVDEAVKFSIQDYDAHDAALYQDLVAQKRLTVHTPDLGKFRQAVQSAYEGEWNAKYGKDLIARIRAMQ